MKYVTLNLFICYFFCIAQSRFRTVLILVFVLVLVFVFVFVFVLVVLEFVLVLCVRARARALCSCSVLVLVLCVRARATLIARLPTVFWSAVNKDCCVTTLRAMLQVADTVHLLCAMLQK